MNKEALIILILTCSINGRVFAKKSAATPKQFPGLIYFASDERDGPEHVCRGEIDLPVQIRQIGISPEDVRQGVECVVGDFDGNGFIDYAFFNTTGWAKKDGWVAFFKGLKIERVVPVHVDGSEVLLRKESGKPDALWLFKTTYIYRFNSKKNFWFKDERRQK